MTKQDLQIECSKCGKIYEAESYKGIKCQSCGAPLRMVAVIKSELSVEDMLSTVKFAGKDKENGKKKRDYKVIEGMAGAEYSVSRDKYVDKVRVIDRTANRYYEKVINPDNNEVMHYCEESLTEHFGHGSAKNH